MAAEKDPGQESNLGAYSPVDYMSITSFPRLPEDDAVGGDSGLRCRKEEDAFLVEGDTDPDSFLKSARLQRLPSSSSEMGSQDVSPLRVTNKDPFSGDCSCRQDGLTVIITACLTFATGVTIALVMQVYFGDSQVFHQGTVVTDATRCTALGIEVLTKQGSSVDAAIASVLCSGIINPHTSGIGGGGVMIVHDIRTNESNVIDFRETAPSAILEESLKSSWKTKPGLLVGVPGMLRGMYQAHLLYGRLPWSELMSMVAGIARDGFNVTHDLAQALTEHKTQNTSDQFRETFLPEGQPLLPGMSMRWLEMADILDSVGTKGVSAFYNSNLTQDMVSEIQEYGGVMTEEDFSNYSALLGKPIQGVFQGHLVFAPPPPHVGAALLTALNILEWFNLTSQTSRETTLHWITETLKIALATASTLGDPSFDPSLPGYIEDILSKSETSFLRQLINDSQSFPTDHYMTFYTLESGPAASQVLVVGPDDFIVAVVSSLNRPFGSGIMTPSGILLNSQMMDFSWQNDTANHSTLSPVLINVLAFNKNLSDSLTLGRLHPQLQSNILEVDDEFSKEDVEFLQARGHIVKRVESLSIVHGARRSNDLIIGVKDPRSIDAGASTVL
ncbi:glutathione hydrolase 7 isoform X2 [Ambystoma mexicanum]|uniref:glutathione hydrolase 7 isoform X2 n=1 Tax=Ambystoma mexicanum TaxID=8296 RepID=UPI0037E779BC